MKLLHALSSSVPEHFSKLSARFGAGVFLCCSLLLTVVLLLPASVPLKLIVGIAGALLAGGVWAVRNSLNGRNYYALLLLCLGICLGGLSFAVFDTIYYCPALKMHNARADFSAVVLDYGTVYDEKQRVRLLVTDSDGLNSHTFYSYVYLDADLAIAPGDTLTGWCRFYLPQDTESFRLRQWYRSQRVYLLTEMSEAAVLTSGTRQSLYVTLRYLIPARCAQWVRTRLTAMTDAETAPVLVALILGDTTGLDDSYVENMRKTGLSHITAVSGMNVSLIAGFFLLLLRRRTGSVVAIPAVVLFMLMTGAGASVTRATIMQIILLTSYLLHEETGALNTLCVTLVLMLAVNPYAIQDIGLILSFASSLGLTLYAGGMQYRLMKPFQKLSRPVKRVITLPISLTVTTVCAQLFTLPLTIFVFGSFSLVSPLSNLLVVWASELAFFGGAIGILLPTGLAAVLFGKTATLAVRYQLLVVPFLARLPFPMLYRENPYSILELILLYSALILLLLHRKESCSRIRDFTPRLVCLFVILLSLVVFGECFDSERRLTVGILDTGGGSCTALIQGSNCVVINCGGLGDGSAEELADFLHRYRQYNIDLLIITDYNSAECSGLEALSSLVNVRHTLLPRQRDGTLPDKLITKDTIDADSVEALQIGSLNLRLLTNRTDGFDCNRMAVYVTSPAMTLLYPGSISPENLSGLLNAAGITDADLISVSPYYASHELPFPGHWQIIPSYVGLDSEQTEALLAKGVSVVDLYSAGNTILTFPAS